MHMPVKRITMAVLKFVCPTSGAEVDTGLDLDPQALLVCRATARSWAARIALIRTFLRTFKLGWANSNLNTSNQAKPSVKALANQCW
jgi:hypothetical protein